MREEGMREAGLVRLTVDVEKGAEPITGAVLMDGVIRQFQGWTALASAIEWALGLGRSGAQAGTERGDRIEGEGT